MNWAKIATYAAALFGVQFALSFFEGLFFSPHTTAGVVGSIIGGSVASFAASAAVFAHLSAHQSFRLFTHASLALLLQVAADSLLAHALAGWLGSTPPLLVALEWLVLVCALVAGTAIGSYPRRRRAEPADA